MKWKTLRGREAWTRHPEQYRIDWDDKSLSKFQFAVKQFLRPYWQNHVLYEELPVAGTRMRLDFYNATKRVAVECDGEQHTKYNKHWHRGSFSTFQKQLMRDDSKEQWCELNGLTLVRITPADVPLLGRAWFKEHYKVDL